MSVFVLRPGRVRRAVRCVVFSRIVPCSWTLFSGVSISMHRSLTPPSASYSRRPPTDIARRTPGSPRRIARSNGSTSRHFETTSFASWARNHASISPCFTPTTMSSFEAFQSRSYETTRCASVSGLGVNVRYCYPLDQSEHPEGVSVDGDRLRWSWREQGPGSFSYPLSLNGHIFRTTDVKRWLGRRHVRKSERTRGRTSSCGPRPTGHDGFLRAQCRGESSREHRQRRLLQSV